MELKRFSTIVLFFCFCTLLFSSCEINKMLPGEWNPIELSQSEITFDAKGGSCTVECKNYPGWWINGIQITGTDIYYPSDPGENYTYLTATGNGISVKIGPEKNAVIITVTPSSEQNDWTVLMEAGDAFTSIRVRQNLPS